MPDGQRGPSSTFHFAAGLSTGVLSAALLQPADLLKTRVQQSRHSSLLSSLREIRSGPSPWRQLWRGTLPSMIRTGFGSALYFSSLNALRQRAAQSHIALLDGSSSAASFGTARTTKNGITVRPSSSTLPRLSPLANLATGAMARVSAGLVLMPVTVVKVRYESSLYAYRSLWDAATGILRTEGARGFFTGFGATAVRDAPYAGLYIVFYESLKTRLSALAPFVPERLVLPAVPPAAPASSAASAAAAAAAAATASTRTAATVRGKTEREKRTNEPPIKPAMASATAAASINFASGVLAAGLATALTNPFDAVKTRLQLLPGTYVNMVQAARTMVAQEGVRSLLDGLALRMARKAMSSALAWTLYEELIRRAEMRWEDGAGRM